MSWSLQVMPLHRAAVHGVLDWASGASTVRGLRQQQPTPAPLYSPVEFLSIVRDAGCHGTAWFEVSGVDASSLLPACPDPLRCAQTGGLDLGEISLDVVDPHDADRVIPSEAGVESVSFRKPVSLAVLTAASALAWARGPHVIFDDEGDCVFVAWPGELVSDLAQEWPW